MKIYGTGFNKSIELEYMQVYTLWEPKSANKKSFYLINSHLINLVQEPHSKSFVYKFEA